MFTPFLSNYSCVINCCKLRCKIYFQNGIVHRDLKLENIFIDSRGNAKVGHTQSMYKYLNLLLNNFKLRKLVSVSIKKNVYHPFCPQIGDFGLANVFSNEAMLHTFCGSPLYASPEIVNGLPYIGPEVRFLSFINLHLIQL